MSSSDHIRIYGVYGSAFTVCGLVVMWSGSCELHLFFGGFREVRVFIEFFTQGL